MPELGKVRTLVIPPPVGGINRRDAIMGLGAEYAIDLENVIPRNGALDLRNGSTIHGTGVAGSASSDAVLSLGVLDYSSIAGSIRKLLAYGDNGKVYNATSAGAAVDISGAVTLTGDICNFLQFRDRVFIKTESIIDDVYQWGGAGNIAAAGFTGPAGDDKLLLAMGAYKSRMYFGQKGAPIFWYGGVDAVTGALTQFDLTSIFSKGFQEIFFIGPVTRAKNFTEDELLCIVTNNGEVLIYQGEYPGSVTWGLLGRYEIPRPLQINSFFYIGACLHIVTEQGVLSITDIMAGAGSDGAWPTISRNIDPAFIEDLETYATSGLEYYVNGIVYPKGEYLLVSMIDINLNGKQWVRNSSGAWTRFSGQNAFCWARFLGDLYFGTNYGKVMKANSGYFDEDPNNAGNAKPRNVKIQPSYNYFGDPYHQKQFANVRPYVYQSEGLNLTIDADVDYENRTPTSTVTDTSDTSYKLYRPTCGLTGVGKAASIRIEQTVTTKRMSLQALEVFWNEGDIR